ncbi:MAG: DNA-protecting protein DprA [Legionellales bacterium]|nr:MAG: DNA-protecting protein DprA [Legionellales bacterium]
MKTYKNNKLRYLLALWRMPGIGPVSFVKWQERYHDLEYLFQSKGRNLLPGDRKPKTLAYLAAPDWQGVDKDLAWAEDHNHHILTSQHKLYPKLLHEISNAPPILFVKGKPQYLSRPQIAIVGSRNPSNIGRDLATEFADHFSGLGLTVTSGLALGVDVAGHTAALKNTGGTIAVVATGLDIVYPQQHTQIAREIVANGALVSEFPIGVQPLPQLFPRRNRIISGLSMGVLVIEAALNSGSLITARQALDQNREVFAIPGSMHNPLAKGCHALIKQGAKLVECAEDVLIELEILLDYVAAPKNPTKKPVDLDNHQTMLLECMDYECNTIDSIVARGELRVEQVTSMLLQLELLGYIVAVPGGYAKTLAAN